MSESDKMFVKKGRLRRNGQFVEELLVEVRGDSSPHIEVMPKLIDARFEIAKTGTSKRGQ